MTTEDLDITTILSAGGKMVLQLLDVQFEFRNIVGGMLKLQYAIYDTVIYEYKMLSVLRQAVFF